MQFRYIILATTILISVTGCSFGPAPQAIQLGLHTNKECVDKTCKWVGDLITVHDDATSFAGAKEKAKSLIGLTEDEWIALEANPHLTDYLKRTAATELYFELRKSDKVEIFRLTKVWPRMANEMDEWARGISPEGKNE